MSGQTISYDLLPLLFVSATETKTIPLVSGSTTTNVSAELREYATTTDKGATRPCFYLLRVTDPTGDTYLGVEGVALIHLARGTMVINGAVTGCLSYSLGVRLPSNPTTGAPVAPTWHTLDDPERMYAAVRDRRFIAMPDAIDQAFTNGSAVPGTYFFKSLETSGNTLTAKIICLNDSPKVATLVIDASADQWKLTSAEVDGKPVDLAPRPPSAR